MKGIEEQRKYWREQLSALTPPPQLPWDKERPPVSSFIRGRFTMYLEPEQWQAIKELTIGTSTTPQVVLLSALYALLFRYTGQTDLVIGTVISSRDEQRTVMVPLRVQLGSDLMVRDLILRIATAINEASEHVGLPLVALSGLAGHDNFDLKPLFNTALIFSSTEEGIRMEQSSDPGMAEVLTECSIVFNGCVE